MNEASSNQIVLSPQQKPALGLYTGPISDVFIDLWKNKVCPSSRRSYKDAVKTFCEFLRENGYEEYASAEAKALDFLITRRRGEATILVISYVNWLKSQKPKTGEGERVSVATISHRVSALKSFVRLAYQTEKCSWLLNIKMKELGITVENTRDMSGPTPEQIEALRIAASRQKPLTAARDSAMLWLLFGHALRRNEVATLDVEHFDFVGNCVFVMRKRKTQRVWITLTDQCIRAVKFWLSCAKIERGPVFVSLSNVSRGRRLTGEGIWGIVSALGESIGLEVWPHALRHSATTEGLHVTGGNISAVQQFTGHADANTVMRYNDARLDQGAEVARQIAALHPEIDLESQYGESEWEEEDFTG